jgi:DNA-binding MarR family transcriptional regulator
MKSKSIRSINEIHEKFNRIVKLSAELEKTPRPYGTDELLTSSEIHLIETVGDNDGFGVTDLAKLSGITKGAVSQLLKKIERKGLVYKEEDPENLSRSIVRLTSKGKAAYYAHRHWHETMDGGFKAYYMNLDEEKILFLFDFINRVEDFLTRIINTEK